MVYGQSSLKSESPLKTIEGLTLVWHDEFDIDGKLDPLNWTYETGFVRNQELQWYQPENAYCKNGLLIIEGKNETVPNPNYNQNSTNWKLNRQQANYTSACITTKNLHEWKSGGYFEVRAKIDTTLGAWPAIWLLGTHKNWPHCGEIDMLEYYLINNQPHILANVAWGSNKKHTPIWDSEKKPFSIITNNNPSWVNEFHIWAMKWNENKIELYLDEELINTIDLSKTINPDGFNPFKNSNNHYLLLNLALGSNGGTPDSARFPITFKVDYVRVYQKDLTITNKNSNNNN